MKSQVQEMAQTTFSDLLDSQSIHSNWNTTSHLPIFADGSNNTNANATASPGDEIDDLRYSMTTTVILM